jgi:hypothetical protein
MKSRTCIAAPVHQALGFAAALVALAAVLAPVSESPAPPAPPQSPDIDLPDAPSTDADVDAAVGDVPEVEVDVHDNDGPPRPAFLIITDGEKLPAVLYESGEVMLTEWQTVWRSMCGAAQPGGEDHGGLSDHDLAAIAEGDKQFQATVQPPEQEPYEPGQRGGGGGFHVRFLFAASVPAEARPGFEACAAYLESLFSNSMTVTVRVNFMGLPPGVLGSTGAKYTSASWTRSRNGLVATMDSNDVAQAYLPSGSSIPVRYNANRTTVTNETRVFWTKANFKAAIGSVNGIDAVMTFNINFNWDFDASDGVTGYSLQDVLTHEMGHVLGFSSGVDFRDRDIEALDIFRFQRVGSSQYVPRRLSDLRRIPRLASFDRPNDEHCCNLISQKYRMSDGNPYQASHFRTQSAQIGLMAPIIRINETAYPHFFTPADLAMLDAIGYDR